MAQVFLAPTRKMYFLTVGYGNCRAAETVENELHVFHCSHCAWELGKRRRVSTVPTATAAGYQHWKKKNHQPPGPNQNEVDKLLMKA